MQNVKAKPNIHIKYSGTPNSKNNLEKQKQIWRTHFSRFQNLIQSYNNLSSILLHKDIHTEKWNTVENQEIDLYILVWSTFTYGKLIFSNGAKDIK